jgi:hypothetical protein
MGCGWRGRGARELVGGVEAGRGEGREGFGVGRELNGLEL